MQPSPSGPFNTYEEFVAALSSSARLATAMSCDLKHFTAQASVYLLRMESILLACNGSQRVFTHLDPSVGNTIIRPIPGLEGEEDWEVTLIDWADSGWFPAWMQAVSFNEKLTMITTMNDLNTKERDQFLAHIAKSFGEDCTEQVDLFKDLARHIYFCLL